MAELVRLFARMRQLFPKHLLNQGWKIAPTLVADYRLILRPRQRPRRNVAVSDVIAQLTNEVGLNPLQQAACEKLLQRADGALMALSGFQYRSARSVLQGCQNQYSTGTIVCAGTGSGKTLAFYLPTLLRIAGHETERATRCLAIYPRNELLKDQMSETYGQVRRLDSLLQSHRRRPIAIGAFYGGTPKSCRSLDDTNDSSGWRKQGNARVCPFLRCPACGSDMLWHDSDRHAEREELACAKSSCRTRTTAEVLPLTRESLLRRPVEILFTSTEMLNQRMSDLSYGKLFGVGTRITPEFVLLDEAHTYSGTHGAQVAMLLRRWRHVSRSRPHFVGLSATLTDAGRFFSQLVGINEASVEAIEPITSEVEPTSMEYMLALRGDPASKTSLLSTTIQASMLMRRGLDPWQGDQSEKAFGRRVFVFTDDLDVTNRLFFNLRDAEGQDSYGKANLQKPDGSLANLRASQRADERLRMSLGQNWKLCEDIGHSLTPQSLVRVTRTSSQDVGVDSSSDLIVATASLEVGFNDPEVGAVIQHKSPRDAAQFLQRKGRAGRQTKMRPWTVVTLSDYGRDRLTWHCYDQLFDPELPARQLPVGNIHVLKIQAAYCLLDWIARELRDSGVNFDASVWMACSGPEVGRHRNLQPLIVRILKSLLEEESDQRRFKKFLKEALDQNEETTDLLMWDPPRAIMPVVVPTLLRRLATGWRRAEPITGGSVNDYHVRNNPIPEFVPQSLFDDLNLPEVLVITPPQTRGGVERRDEMPIAAALTAYAAGRVSRRFGVENVWARHWIAPAHVDGSPEQVIPLAQMSSAYEELGQFDYIDASGETKHVRCVRPLELRPQVPDASIGDTSNAALKWRTQIIPSDEGMPADIPTPSQWNGLVEELRFFCHRDNSPLEVRRFAMASEASISLRNGVQFETRFVFVSDPISESEAPPSPVGLGFAADVDGFVIRFRRPTNLQVHRDHPNQAKLRALRMSRFRDLVMESPALNGIANVFRRQWLAQIYVSALVVRAIESNESIEEAWQQSLSASNPLELVAVLDVVFQSIPRDASDSDSVNDAPADDDDSNQVHQKLHQELSALLHDNSVVHCLQTIAPILWQEIDDSWHDWLRQRFQTTLGSAFLDAIQQLCPDLDAGDLLLEAECGPRPSELLPVPNGLDEIWITERTLGGGGIVERFASRYANDPRTFFDLVNDALRPGDFEVMDEALLELLDTSAATPTLRDRMSFVRAAQHENQQSLVTAFEGLLSDLQSRGLATTHSVIAALNTRIIRPGSTAETDALLRHLLHEWRDQEQRLGIEIDLRVFSFLKSGDNSLDRALGSSDASWSGGSIRQWRFGTLLSMLWPRGSEVRSERLSTWNPFARLSGTEHDLVRDTISSDVRIVQLASEGWFLEIQQSLVTSGRVILRADTNQGAELRTALLRLVMEPIDARWMLLHPRVTGLEHTHSTLDLHLDLVEAAQ